MSIDWYTKPRKTGTNAEHLLRWWLLPKREILTGFVTIGDSSEENWWLTETQLYWWAVKTNDEDLTSKYGTFYYYVTIGHTYATRRNDDVTLGRQGGHHARNTKVKN